jgi:hypothetical protein
MDERRLPNKIGIFPNLLKFCHLIVLFSKQLMVIFIIMQRILFLMVIGISGLHATAQNVRTPVETVQEQLDAYNKQDIKAFAGVFSENVLVFNKLGDTIPSLKGRQSLEQRYGELFAKYPKNYSTLVGRIVEGDYVIDHELVTGREYPLKMVAIYEVKNGFISRCWFIR